MEEKDYATEIFEYLSNNGGFEEAISVDQFKSTLKSDDTYADTIYDYVSQLDSSFKDSLDLPTFTSQILDFETQEEKDKKIQDQVVEADETVTNIDTDIPQTPGQVNAKYDDYLSILLKDPKDAITLENINLDQTIALDDNGQPLRGQALLDHVNKVNSDKLSLLDLVENQQDEITYAQKLKDIQLKTIPKPEEIKLRMEDTSGEDKREGLVENNLNALSPILSRAFTGTNREILDNEEKPPTPPSTNPLNLSEETLKLLNPKARSKEEEELAANLGIDKLEDKDYFSPRNLYETNVISKKELQRAHLQLTEGAREAGYIPTSDKKKAESDDKYYYIPKIDEVIEAKGFVGIKDKGEGEQSVYYQTSYLANRSKLAEEKLNSREVQKELDEILENFEGEKGISGWNNVVNAFASLATGFGLGKALLEDQIGMTVDELLGMKEGSREAYVENQEQLADAIGLSQKGDDLDIAASIYNLKQDAKVLLTKDAALRQLQRKIETDPSATQEDVDQFNKIKNEIILTQKQINANYEYLGDLQFEGNNIQQIIDKTKRSYDELEVLENIFYNSGVRIVTGLGSLANEMNTVNILEWAGVDLKDENVKRQYIDYATDILGDNGGAVVSSMIEANLLADKNADETLKKMSEFGQGLLDKVKEQQRFDEIDGIESALLWGTQMLTGQVLNTGMSIVIPGGGGLLISAASEAGNQMYDMKKRMEGEEWSTKEKLYIQDFKKEFGFNPLGDDDTYRIKPEEINALQFYGTAGIYGAAEYVSEKLALGNFKLGAKNLRKAYDLSKIKGLTRSNKINQRWVNLKETTKDYFKGGIGESFGEGGVTLAQNFAEINILGNKDVSLLDGLTESMVSGFVMSGTMQSPAIAAQTYQAFRGPDRNARIAQRGDDILRISNSIKKNELKLAGLKQNSDSYNDLQQAIQLETAQLHDLAMEQLADQNKTRNDILSYTKEDRQALIDIYNKEHRIRRQIDKVNDNTAISKETADATIDAYTKELIYQEAKKKYILGNAEWNADKNRSNKFANAYRAKNGTLNKVETIVADNNSQALENGLAYVDTMNDLTQEEKNQVKSQMKDQFAEADRASIGPEGEKYSINGFAWGDNLTVETTSPDGTKSTRNIDVPMTFSIKSTALSEGGNITVQSHEVGHHTLFRQFMDNNPDAIGLVEDLERYVKRNYKEAYKNFLEVKNAYGEYTQTGEVKNAAEVAEEKLAALSDFMRQNNLEADRTLHNKLFGRFQKYNDGSGQIRTGKDVFDMITSYNQSFETGELTGLTKAVAEGTVEINRKSKRPVALNKTKPNNTRKSLTVSERQQIEDALNKMPGPKGPDGNYLMSQAEWQADKDRALSKAVTMAMDGTLDGLIVNQMAEGDTIHGLSRDEFMKRVYTKLGMHVYNFNPKVSNNLFGWINTYLGNRVGDVANQAKRQKIAPGPTVSTSKKIGDEGGRTVAETIKGDDADTIIAAVDATMNKQDAAIDNLRTRLGIEKGGPLYNDVVAAVQKTFGRTKLKDVSNIKFKQDLKNKFNTELFKAVKNSLGTRTAYKNFIEGDVVFKNKDGKEIKMPRIKMLFDYFAQEVFNKRFEPFKEKLIDPTTGKQARPENNPLFRKRKNITKKELVDYFLGSDVQASTKGTRKDALASAIAQELAFDATMEVLEDPDIQNKIKEFYELQGLTQAENFLEKVGKIIDRKPGAKFSRTKAGSIKDNSKVINDAISYFESKEGDVRSGKDPEVIIDNYYNKLSKEDQSVLAPHLNKMKSFTKAAKKGKVDLNLFREAMAARGILGRGIGLNYYKNVKDWRKQSGLPSQELNEDGSVKTIGLNPINTKTKEGEARYLNQLNNFSQILDNRFTGLGLFTSTLTHGGNIQFFSGPKRINSEGKEVIGSAGSANTIKQNISKNDVKDFNVDTKLAVSVDSKMAQVEQLVIDTMADPNFDPTSSKDQAKLTAEINKIITPKQKAAIEATRDYFFKKLNEYVNSFPEGSPAYYEAVDFAIAVLQGQSNATSGIPRQGATLNSVTMAFSTTPDAKGKVKPFQREHNLQNLNFNFNVLNSILNNSFDKDYDTIASTYHQSLLDTDAQKVLDGQMTTKEFNEKYGTTLNKELLKQITGKTAGLPGFLTGMNSEAMFALALGNAGQTLMLDFGTTLDQVLFNQISGKQGLDYLKGVAKEVKSKLSKTPMGKTILDPKNKEAIFESKENKDLFNKAVSEVVNGQDVDETSIKLGIKLENKENYDQRDEVNNDQLNNSGVTTRFSKSKNTNKDVIDESTKLDNALDVARNPEAPIKKIRVFDFDDTLATSKNIVIARKGDQTIELNAEEFAKRGLQLKEDGWDMDFSDFNRVTEGGRGPLFEVAQKIKAARGNEDLFVLTARAPEAADAIYDFLKQEGLEFKKDNIVGLGNSTGEAKAQWLVGKAAEGYNDFYFADDAIQNVDAVKLAMSQLDVKSKVQQAKIRFSKTVDQTVNDMLEHKFGIKSEAEYGKVKARLVGRKKGKFKLFIPPSAEDFVGLLYSMLGKGEIGNMQMDFFKEHLIEPYGRAMENLSRDQNRIVNDFKALKDQLVQQGLIPKNLNKKAVGKYTVQDVSRILAWDKQGFKIPGLSQTDLNKIKKYAKDNPAVDVFAQSLIDINKGDGYAAPDDTWLAGTISTDLLDGLRTGKRSKYLKQWQENVDIIFSEKNLNKMEAAMGSNWREAMEDMLRRMKSGQNRSSTAGRLENRLLDYINNSVGTVMFFNMRSALLQTISSVNFIDFGVNNVFKAAAAFANQKQYWSDFMKLMNSEFLVERRNGLRLNVSESEIADAAATSKNKAKAAIAYILKKGYLPTQFADSFAIASGGATFYRNKIKDLMKKNPDMTLEQAEKQAFQEFRELAEESQQSSRPDRISQQQASTLGRLILAFQNTPMQMNRLGKKSFQDLVNRRKRPGMTQFQSDMSNISRIGYYMAVQSLIFSSLQQALFALAFDDEEPEDEKERYYNVANGVINTILNGTGIIGVSVSTLLSVARKVYKESSKEGTFPGPAYEDAANEMLNFSPPIDIKLSKLRQGGLTWKYEGYKHDEAKWGIDDPAWKSAAYVISGLTNVPLDRLLNKAENVRSAVQDDWEMWQRTALLLGWSKYQIQSGKDRLQEIEDAKAEKAAFRKRIRDSKKRSYYFKKPLTLEQVKKEKDQEEFDKYKKMNKPRQVEILDSLGLTKKQIRNLKYEKDRVAKIIQLMNQ